MLILLMLQANVELKQQHSATLLKVQLDFDTKLKRVQAGGGGNRPAYAPHASNNALMQRVRSLQSNAMHAPDPFSSEF